MEYVDVLLIPPVTSTPTQDDGPRVRQGKIAGRQGEFFRVVVGRTAWLVSQSRINPARDVVEEAVRKWRKSCEEAREEDRLRLQRRIGFEPSSALRIEAERLDAKLPWEDQ